MTLAMNLLLWGSDIDERLFPVLEEIHMLGFVGVEIPIFNTDPARWQAAGGRQLMSAYRSHFHFQKFNHCFL